MAAGPWWARRALRGAARELTTITYLFHAIDLVGGDEIAGLPTGFVARRALAMPIAAKRRFVERTLDALVQTHTPQLSRDWVEGQYPPST